MLGENGSMEILSLANKWISQKASNCSYQFGWFQFGKSLMIHQLQFAKHSCYMTYPIEAINLQDVRYIVYVVILEGLILCGLYPEKDYCDYMFTCIFPMECILISKVTAKSTHFGILCMQCLIRRQAYAALQLLYKEALITIVDFM